MITGKQLLNACRHETKVIKHLATRLPEDSMDWRPTEGQRSMLELMRYLASGPQIMAVSAVTDPPTSTSLGRVGASEAATWSGTSVTSSRS